MHKKHVPMRKCSGCGEIRPKKDLVRIVKTSEDDGVKIALDLSGKKNGRGAYLCKNQDCLKSARKARRIERAFSCKIPTELYDQLKEELLINEQ